MWNRCGFGRGRAMAGVSLFLLLLAFVAMGCGGRSGEATSPLAAEPATVPPRSAPSDPRSSSTVGDRAADDVVAIAVGAGLEDPAAVELPPAADGDELRVWLEGEGAPVALVVATEPLWRDGQGACDRVAVVLDEAGSPEAMLAAASAVPEEVTRELLVDLHAATVRLLASCEDSATFASQVREFAWQWALAERRLDELGVER